MEVHKQLGNGFLEAVYQEALELEFIESKIPYDREAGITISYKNKILAKRYIADLICFDNIIVELKSVSDLIDQHYKQIFNYLKATNMQLGLILNFGSTSLQFKRIIV